MRTFVITTALLAVSVLSGCSTLGGQAVSSIAPATYHAAPVNTGTLQADFSANHSRSELRLASFETTADKATR